MPLKEVSQQCQSRRRAKLVFKEHGCKFNLSLARDQPECCASLKAPTRVPEEQPARLL